MYCWRLIDHRFETDPKKHWHQWSWIFKHFLYQKNLALYTLKVTQITCCGQSGFDEHPWKTSDSVRRTSKYRIPSHPYTGSVEGIGSGKHNGSVCAASVKCLPSGVTHAKMNCTNIVTMMSFNDKIFLKLTGFWPFHSQTHIVGHELSERHGYQGKIWIQNNFSG